MGQFILKYAGKIVTGSQPPCPSLSAQAHDVASATPSAKNGEVDAGSGVEEPTYEVVSQKGRRCCSSCY